MRIIRCSFIALGLLIGVANPAHARVDIDLNFSVEPEFVAVPGYPVYYAPRVERNFFFYDGQYWLYEDDEWYSSDWYNGPWEYVDPDDVPLFVLRVPVRYYRRPPVYFRAWIMDAPPRWGNHWGGGWERNHSGWDRWDHHHVPSRAPLPNYHRDYPDNHSRDRDERHDQDRHDRYDRDNDERQHHESLPQRPQPDTRRDDPERAIHQRIPYQPRPPSNRVQQQPSAQPQANPNPAPRNVSAPQQMHGRENNNRTERNEGRGSNNEHGRGEDK